MAKLIITVNQHHAETGFVNAKPSGHVTSLESGITYDVGQRRASRTRSGFNGVNMVVQVSGDPAETGTRSL